ncbi:hypothetical protein GCM10011416_01010 [Polaribacter pacificus]|uniref:Uncharacterized protein n=1 Tax=Polaribacter pacificus TaxID=1775173 RepID=A0A917MAR3_9FLAO|nr:hypothetical protein [Polaribacter pacificus]GGG88550.1 hypothetical protein GCM10011416_01010 [Polaribacter pacificus]
MSSVIFKYKKQIETLNPLQDSCFLYDSKRWSKLNTESKKLVAVYENKVINRKDVIDAFIKYYQGEKEYLYPFILTMIWGFADTGYGTYRTNKYLSSHENKNLIEDAFGAIRDKDIEKAYKLLMKIKGLNISYVSKLLYFGTRARGYKDHALIFDIRVARSLVKLLDVDGDISGLLDITPSNKYKDFDNYNKLIHRWAKELDVAAENVEMFLFDGKF